MISRELRIQYSEYTGTEALPEPWARLVEAARKAADQAYSPYSGFRVGAAVLLADGTVLTGNNQENAAYPSGLCAERTVLFYVNANFPGVPVEAMAITAANARGQVNEPVKPCGACRQVLLETEARYSHPIRMILDGKKRIQVFNGIDDLLPFSFKPASLKG